jgi:hypothetical protein
MLLMGSKTNRSLQAKADKRKRQMVPLRMEAQFKAKAFEYAQEHVTVPGAYPTYWVERDYDTSKARRARLRAHW